MAEILNLQLTASITYHKFLHRLRAGRGTGTATLEAKLLKKLAAFREKVLYMIFLDLHKEYDALERSICLEILAGYRMGPRACQILQTYWGRLRMVPKAGGILWVDFPGIQGGNAGGPIVTHHLQRGGVCSGETFG